MTSSDLSKSFYIYNRDRYEIIATNIFVNWGCNEMDIMAIRKSGYVDEIEIKMSRSDFLADFKKTAKVKDELIKTNYGSEYYKYKDILKHEALPKGECVCNRFSFYMPEELAEKCDIPVYAGLYVYSVGKGGGIYIKEVKKAALLHKRKISERLKYETARKMTNRYWNQIIYS